MENYLLIKSLINKSFPDYEKMYYFKNNKFFVKFIVKDIEVVIFIKREEKWCDLIKKINRQIDLSNDEEEMCNVCCNLTYKITYCSYCTYRMCFNCFFKIKANNSKIICPQCRLSS